MNQDYHSIPTNDFSSFEQQPGQMPPTGHAKGFAIASLCLGIAALVVCCLCCCFYYIAVVLSAVSIVMAILAKRDNGGKMPPMAIAGLIMAIIGIVFFLCMLVFEICMSTVSDEQLYAILDPYFEDTFGMSFKEYMEQMEYGLLE